MHATTTCTTESITTPGFEPGHPVAPGALPLSYCGVNARATGSLQPSERKGDISLPIGKAWITPQRPRSRRRQPRRAASGCPRQRACQT